MCSWGAILKERTEAGSWWKAFGGTFLFCLLLIGGIARFSMAYVKKFSSKRRDLLALSALLLLALGFCRFVMEVCEAAASPNGLAVESIWFVVPVAGCSLLVRVLLDSETALAFSLLASILCGVAMGLDVNYTAYFVITSIVAAGVLGLDSDRKAVLKAGLVAGLAGAGFILIAHWMHGNPNDPGVVIGGAGFPWEAAAFSIVGGLLSAFLVLALLPLFEMAGFVTDLQLLELSNLNHPLLSNLLMRRRSYHSVMVETPPRRAQEVGCNPCGVAAYFHDIGKAVSPQYFVENQRSGESPPAARRKCRAGDHRSCAQWGREARRHKLRSPS